MCTSVHVHECHCHMYLLVYKHVTVTVLMTVMCHSVIVTYAHDGHTSASVCSSLPLVVTIT